jgi:hypothetical protein
MIKAVLFGVTIDIVGSDLIRSPLFVIYGVILAAQGQSSEEIQRAMELIDPLSAFGLVLMLFGSSMSLLGGYVCARTANVYSYTPVGVVSAISVGFGTLVGVGDIDWPLLLLLNLLGLMAIFAGGWWHIRKLHALSRK